MCRASACSEAGCSPDKQEYESEREGEKEDDGQLIQQQLQQVQAAAGLEDVLGRPDGEVDTRGSDVEEDQAVDHERDNLRGPFRFALYIYTQRRMRVFSGGLSMRAGPMLQVQCMRRAAERSDAHTVFA